jgi:hypothetical protein
MSNISERLITTAEKTVNNRATHADLLTLDIDGYINPRKIEYTLSKMNYKDMWFPLYLTKYFHRFNEMYDIIDFDINIKRASKLYISGINYNEEYLYDKKFTNAFWNFNQNDSEIYYTEVEPDVDYTVLSYNPGKFRKGFCFIESDKPRGFISMKATLTFAYTIFEQLIRFSKIIDIKHMITTFIHEECMNAMHGYNGYIK